LHRPNLVIIIKKNHYKQSKKPKTGLKDRLSAECRKQIAIGTEVLSIQILFVVFMNVYEVKFLVQTIALSYLSDREPQKNQ
jgi:hypothetical protein